MPTRVTSRAASTWRLAAAVALLSLTSLACRARVGDEPARRPPQAHAGVTASDGCASCHPAIAREWRASRHAGSWTDPLVQREYRDAPDERCRGCHAPRSRPGQDLREPAARDGIDCVTCHARELAGLGGDKSLETAPGPTPCRECHQFRFLQPPGDDAGAIPYDPDGWLQDTWGEWSRSQAARAGRSCRDCHMAPARNSEHEREHASHRFPGMLDREFVARAVDIELAAARRGGVVLVHAQLSTTEDIGHAFPTGDMFRVAVLRVWTDERESDADERQLRRWFRTTREEREGGDVRLVHRQVDDTRVPPPGAGPPRTFELRLRSPAARHVAWSLDLYARDPQEPGVSPEQRSAIPTTRVAAGRVAIKPDPQLIGLD